MGLIDEAVDTSIDVLINKFVTNESKREAAKETVKPIVKPCVEDITAAYTKQLNLNSTVFKFTIAFAIAAVVLLILSLYEWATSGGNASLFFILFIVTTTLTGIGIFEFVKNNVKLTPTYVGDQFAICAEPKIKDAVTNFVMEKATDLVMNSMASMAAPDASAALPTATSLPAASLPVASTGPSAAELAPVPLSAAPAVPAITQPAPVTGKGPIGRDERVIVEPVPLYGSQLPYGSQIPFATKSQIRNNLIQIQALISNTLTLV